MVGNPRLKAYGQARQKAETALFQRVAEHRELFFRFSWVDYTTHKPGTFRLTPPAEHLSDWKSDYAAMLGPMFFGETPSFEEIITIATAFETTFNATANPDSSSETSTK